MAGSVFIVTGASSGIGRAIAEQLADGGRRVVAVGRNAAALDALRQRVGPLIEPACVDLADRSAVDDFGNSMARAHPALAGLIHSAGVIVPGSLSATSAEDLDRMMAVNFCAPFLLTSRLVEALAAGRGNLVFVNSTAALSPAAGRAAYGASKSALRAFADAARLELNERGIRVASIYPGRTATEGMSELFAVEGRDYDADSLLQPEDVAATVVGLIDTAGRAEVMDVVLRPHSKTY